MTTNDSSDDRPPLIRTRHLTSDEKDELLRWFLHHMPMDQRTKLMGTYPVHYGILFPTADVEAITSRVILAISTARLQRDPIESRMNL